MLFCHYLSEEMHLRCYIRLLDCHKITTFFWPTVYEEVYEMLVSRLFCEIHDIL